MIRVDVVICTYNGAARLPRTLECLSLQDVERPMDWKLLLVDNASTDETSEVVAKIWPELSDRPFEVIQELKPGKVNAIVTGLSHSDAELVVFLDDDNWADSKWLETAIAMMDENPKLAACSGYNEPCFEGPEPCWFEQFQMYYAIGSQENVHGVEHLWGAGLCLRKSAWVELLDRGFRFQLGGRSGKGLVGGSDTELTLALRVAGWEIAYNPNLRLIHYMPAGRLNFKHLARIAWGNGIIAPTMDAYRYHTGGEDGNSVQTSWWRYWFVIAFKFVKGLFQRKLWRHGWRHVYLRSAERLANLYSLGKLNSGYESLFAYCKGLTAPHSEQQ